MELTTYVCKGQATAGSGAAMQAVKIPLAARMKLKKAKKVNGYPLLFGWFFGRILQTKGTTDYLYIRRSSFVKNKRGSIFGGVIFFFFFIFFPGCKTRRRWTVLNIQFTVACLATDAYFCRGVYCHPSTSIFP